MSTAQHGYEEDYHYMKYITSYDGGDDDDRGTNSTCAQYTSCTDCLDFYDREEGEGCLWCRVPVSKGTNVGTVESGGGNGGGLCLQRSKAQDRCEIGELQASCEEGIGWYVLVLSLCAMMSCCCFLTMAKKFAAVWHERRWRAASGGGDLTHPLLDDEEREEQAHEAVIRGSLVDGLGGSWRCPVCGFDNRPLCKNCDLCDISSEFAEAYWKEKDAPKRKSGSAKRSGPKIEDGKVGPKSQLPSAGSGVGDGSSTVAAVTPGPEGGDRSQEERQRGADYAVAVREQEQGEKIGEEESESEADESESVPLLGGPRDLTVAALPAGLGSVQGSSGTVDVLEDGGESDGSVVRAFEWERTVSSSSEEVSEKSRVTAFPLRRASGGGLTERQKRARRRRIWQRVMGPNGTVCWRHTLESPATAAAAAAADMANTYNESSSSALSFGSSTARQPPFRTSTGNPADSFNLPSGGVGTARLGGVPTAAANAAAILRYWASTRAYHRPRLEEAAAPVPDPRPDEADAEAGDLTVVSNVDVTAAVGRRRWRRGRGNTGEARLAPGTATDGPDGTGERTEDLLSDAERGEGSDRRMLLPREEANEGRGESRVIQSGGFEEALSLGEEGGAGEDGGGGGSGRGDSRKGSSVAAVVSVTSEAAAALRGEESRVRRVDSFGDEEMLVSYPGYYTTFLEGGGLTWDMSRDSEEVARPNTPPPSASRRGPAVGEGLSSDTVANIGTDPGTGTLTGPAARRGGWADGAARRREARREAEASEEWVNTTKADVAKLCEISALPFWQKHSWFLDQLRLLQAPHGGGMEAMRIEVHRNNLLEDSFAQVSAMNTGELRRWLRVQFVGEPGVDAGGLEREWFLLVCRSLFDPSTGLFTPQACNNAFAISPSSGVANEMHLEYFRFTGRVLGKLLMEHSVAPYHLSLPILKHLLGLPVAFSDLEFADAELHRNLKWLRANSGATALGLDFTVTLESFGVKEVAELLPGGKDMVVNDDNKEEYLELRLKHHVLGGIHDQLWNLMRGFYDVIPSHLIWVFDYQELELLLCGIPVIDVSEWKRHSRYLGEYRRTAENHRVIKWFWEVLEEFSEAEKARFLQFCTGTSRLPPHGFKALQSNDGSFRAFTVQSITKRESAFPRAHTCFNKLDLPMYDTKKELEECVRLCICFELTGFTMD